MPNGAVGPFHRIGINELSAKSGGNLFAGEAHVLRHHQRDRNAQGSPYPRIGDACVSAGRIDERFSGREPPALLGVQDHLKRWPILHAAARIEVLELRVDLHVRVPIRPAQPQQRSIPHEMVDRSECWNRVVIQRWLVRSDTARAALETHGAESTRFRYPNPSEINGDVEPQSLKNEGDKRTQEDLAYSLGRSFEPGEVLAKAVL